jgi:hypothetical protein
LITPLPPVSDLGESAFSDDADLGPAIQRY